jgi:hypothetical protein
MSNCNIAGHWAEEHDSDARRLTEKRRQIHHKSNWISVERALEIEGTTDPTRLRMEIKQGLPCRFQDSARRCWKAIEEVAPLLTGRNPLDLQDARWALVVHEKYWRERLGKPAASAPAADVPPPPVTEKIQVRDAADDDVRIAMRAVCSEKGDERLNINKIISPVRSRLEAGGLYAKWETIKRIAGEKEFRAHRRRGRRSGRAHQK